MFVRTDEGVFINLNHIAKVEIDLSRNGEGYHLYGPSGNLIGQVPGGTDISYAFYEAMTEFGKQPTSAPKYLTPRS